MNSVRTAGPHNRGWPRRLLSWEFVAVDRSFSGGATSMMKRDFLSDIREIRRRAREHLERGAVTENYQAELGRILALLNEALATELVCILRYKMHSFVARGIHAEPVAREFREHAAEEQGHADRIAERITQLGAIGSAPWRE